MALLIALFLAVQTVQDTVAEKPVDDEQSKIAVSAEAIEFTSRLKIAIANASTIERHPAPILRWSNPTVGKVFGEVFLWSDHGKPVAIACWYRWFEPNWGKTLEVCSLTTQNVSATVDGRTIWDTKKPGIKIEILENVEPAAQSPAHRLTQMRRLANEFVANLDDTRTDSIVERRLRLLPQPIYRYPADASTDLVDGAIFTFVEGTDPEALLLLEATKDGRWQVAIGRMNRDAMRVAFRNNIIWSAAKITNSLELPSEPYCLVNCSVTR